MRRVVGVCALVALGWAAFASQASASIVIEATRVIFPSDRDEVVVRLTNGDPVPKLIQAWIDDGDVDARPEDIVTPFQILTPVFRIEPGKGQVLRIRNLGARELPKDRETVYWLNVLEIPPKPGDDQLEGQNYLQFAFRNRIKVFVRPPRLPGAALGAPEALRWQYRGGSLEVTNPTSFHVSLANIKLDGQPVSGAMLVRPLSAERIPLQGPTAPPVPAAGAKVQYVAIDDYGAAREISHELSTERVQDDAEA